MRMSITYRQNTWVKLLPKIQFSINSTPSRATGLSPYYIEKGRHAVTNLDRDNILRRGDSTDPDIDEFVAGIHNIEQEVRERMELTRQWMERDADKRRRDMPTSPHPGAYAYLSTNGITLPWDKERRSASYTTDPTRYYVSYHLCLSNYNFQLPQEFMTYFTAACSSQQTIHRPLDCMGHRSLPPRILANTRWRKS